MVTVMGRNSVKRGAMRDARITFTAIRRAVLVALLMLGPVLGAATRGPDAGGYKATDEAVYSFVDIAAGSGGASILGGADDSTAVLTLPFVFKFYGTGYTQVCVSSNGAIYFVTTAGACAGIGDFANTDLTTTATAGDLPALLPFWSDLTFQLPGAGAVFYQTMGTPGARKFVVQWDNAYPQDSQSPVTFQAILSEGTDRILFQYKTVDLGDGNPATRGTAATIGIRNVNGAVTTQQIEWSFNVPVIPNESALLFSPAGQTTPVVAWANPADIVVGTPLSTTQLNATANVEGTFAYNPGAGTLLPVGEGQTLSALFTPSDTVNYTTATANVRINVKPPLAVSVLAPNGGEITFVGIPTTLRWSASGEPTSIDVQLSRNGGDTYSPIAGCSTLSGSVTSCNWTPSGPGTLRARIRVIAHRGNASASDASNANFIVSSIKPIVEIIAPLRIANWTIGTKETIRWIHDLGINTFMRVELSRNGGLNWETLAASVQNTNALLGSMPWLVTGPPGSNALVRVTWLGGPAADTSGPFDIKAPSIVVISPNTAVDWRIGDTRTIVAKSNLGAGQTVTLEITRDGGSTWSPIATVQTTADDTLSYAWRVTGPTTSRARIRARWAANQTVSDTSDHDFTIRR